MGFINIRPARLCTVNTKSSITGGIGIESNGKHRVGDAVVGGNKKWRAGSREDSWMGPGQAGLRGLCIVASLTAEGAV